MKEVEGKNYDTGVPIQVYVYEDKIVIFNMGSWSKRVPTDERVYEKHESVPNNPKLADVSFRSGDVESRGRGFLKIKAECMTINAPLPMIDADGVWRNKGDDTKKSDDKKAILKPLIANGKIIAIGNNKDRRYKKGKIIFRGEVDYI